jgi:hypothetical protein
MYYPEQRHTLAWATIRRERLLPDQSIGVVEARNGQYLNLRDVVARGRIPARFIFVEAAEFFQLKKETELVDLMLVEIGEPVEEGQVLAGKQATKGKRLTSPVTGVIVYVGQGRIIIQETPEEIEVEAGLTGQVVGIRANQGVVVEAFGALAQGVWGNDRRLIGPLRVEPEDGLESIYDDTIDRPYAGSIVVTRRSLKSVSLDVLETQNIGGVIAPSMDTALYERALNMPIAILLTEGFGEIRMSSYLFSLLEAFNGRQTTLDAVFPTRWDAGRPEVFINLPPKAGERPPEPRMDLTLQVGMTVRLTRAPYAGMVGQVSNLPKTPQLLDNGLRVFCAQVDVATGGRIMIPLANLEVFGK